MPGVLSTLRDHDNIDQSNNNNVPIINAPETTIFDSSSYESSFESEYSDTDSDNDFFNSEETAEEIEATRFLNELLKNQCRKDGDVERIQSMLVAVYLFLFIIITLLNYYLSFLASRHLKIVVMIHQLINAYRQTAVFATI